MKERRKRGEREEKERIKTRERFKGGEEQVKKL